MNNPPGQEIQLIQEGRTTGIVLIVGGLVFPSVLMFVFWLAGAYASDDGLLIGIAFLVPLFLAVGLIVFGVNTMVQPVNSVTYIMQARAYSEIQKAPMQQALPAPQTTITNYMPPVRRDDADVMTRPMTIAGEVRGQWTYPIGNQTARGDVIEAFIEHYYDVDRPKVGNYRDYVKQTANIQASNDQFTFAAALLLQWGVLDKTGVMVMGKRAALEAVSQKRRQMLT